MISGSQIKRVVSCLDLRPRLGRRDGAVLARYIHDMRRIVCETARVLASGGRAVYVVGENTVRGTFVRNSKIVEEIALEAGLRPASRRSRRLQDSRRYLPPPSRGAGLAVRGGRMQEPAAFSGARPSRQDGPGRAAAREPACQGRARDGTGFASL